MSNTVRFIIVLLVVALLCSLSACKSQDVQQNTGSTNDVPVSSYQGTPESSAVITSSEEHIDVTSETIMPSELTTTEPEIETPLDLTQRNSIAMLNYLAMITQEINASDNSRLFLEDAYSLLINNTNPEVVDERTEEQLSALLDAIESHRMRTLEREQTQYVYEQKKANIIATISELGGSPTEMLKSLGFAVLDFAYDSVKSYEGMLSDAEIDYLESTWQLDRDEAQTIHETRKNAFTYMTSIVRDYQLPGELALNEAAITKFVDWRRNTNVIQQIHFFESEEATYRNFGPYWLELSNCYLKNGDNEKCLAAIATYETMKPTIFRKDYYYAKALPNAIVAAAAIYDETSYIAYAENALNALLDNTDREDWDLRYFAAEAYNDLYARTSNRQYLQNSYDIALDNVNILVEAQKQQNSIYLKDVVEAASADSDSSDVEKLRKAYNEAIKSKRETELAPIYEPLLINCKLLFAQAQKLEISQSEKNKIEQILSDSGAHVFLNEYLDEQYSFAYNMADCKAEFLEDELIIPAEFLTDDTVIRVSVTDSDAGTTDNYSDWILKKVERKSNSFEDFVAHYESETISDQEWTETSKVTVELLDGSNEDPIVTMHFAVSDVTNYYLWKDYTFAQVD